MRVHPKLSEAQERAADKITAFAGSMAFVYLHIIWFGVWIGLGVEGYPYGLLTMVVSLEAIFLSTFVMLSQNRTSAHDRMTFETDRQVDEEALAILRRIEAHVAVVETVEDGAEAEIVAVEGPVPRFWGAVGGGSFGTEG